MVSRAYVMIEVEGGKVARAFPKIKKVRGVTRAEMITGGYDIVAIVEGETLKNLGDLVISKIRKIAGVVKTTTFVVV